MHRCAFWIADSKDEMRVILRGELDGLQAFEQIHDQMSRANGIERIVIDVSEASQVKPIELHYLLTDLAVDPCFSNIDMSVIGLRFTHMSTECPYSRGRGQDLAAGYEASEWVRL